MSSAPTAPSHGHTVKHKSKDKLQQQCRHLDNCHDDSISCYCHDDSSCHNTVVTAVNGCRLDCRTIPTDCSTVSCDHHNTMSLLLPPPPPNYNNNKSCCCCGLNSSVVRQQEHCGVVLLSLALSMSMYLLNLCLYLNNCRRFSRAARQPPAAVAGNNSKLSIYQRRPPAAGGCWLLLVVVATVLLSCSSTVTAFGGDYDKSDQFVDRASLGINLEQSIAAVFNKVAYGSTTKRSIPDNAYPVTTLATPLLTTYRYSDGNDEYFRVDVKHPDNREVVGRSNYDYDQQTDEENSRGGGGGDGFDGGSSGASNGGSYGADLEKDHVLPTSAPAADILKNNNNKHYENPNRYNNDRLKPNYDPNGAESATENVYKTTTNYNALRNVRPTKSIYSKDVPSYVPPSRAFFTPPLPPEYLNPFADKPTLRGTNSDSYANRRPIPPPSIMPNKDRIPFRPDMPSKVINMERLVPDNNNNPEMGTTKNYTYDNAHQQAQQEPKAPEKKKTLNTPSQSVNIDRLGEFYGLNRHNESSSNFEYEKAYIPSITRILSGSNGQRDNIPDILLRTVTATPHFPAPPPLHSAPKSTTKTRAPPSQEQSSPAAVPQSPHPQNSPKIQTPESPRVPETSERAHHNTERTEHVPKEVQQDRSESVTIKKDSNSNSGGGGGGQNNVDLTTQSSEYVNLPNVKQKKNNVTKATSEEIWFISWNVHVYLVVLCYVVLALFSIYKLIRYENDPHMFSKSYFLTIHLMLTVICVLRIFYLTYDPYNVDKSFNIFLYDFLHNFPLSLLATTFAVLILFLLKRTLTHLKVKTRPVFLVVFGLIHIVMCLFLSIFETLGHFDRAGLIVCKPVFVLLAWALGVSYLYLYKIIKNVLAKKSQNLSEMCTQNIGYASHITIAVALLFLVLGCVQLYALFCIKVDRFNGEIKHHWILWGFELSVRIIEIAIITLLAIVVSLKLSQREKQIVGFPLFPCTTSESSSDNIYPNNCNTNPNALNYSRNEMIMENLPSGEAVDRPNLLKNTFQNDSFDKKSTLERYPVAGVGETTPVGVDHRVAAAAPGGNFERFERPKWGSDRFDARQNSIEQTSLNNFSSTQHNSGNFDRNTMHHNSSRSNNERNTGRKCYDTAASKYYTKPKYDVEYNNDDYQHDMFPAGAGAGQHQAITTSTPTGGGGESNVYSEPLDNQSLSSSSQNQYERTRHEFERSDFDRRSSRNSSNTSGRRSTTGRSRKNMPRPHLGVQTLPGHDARHQQQTQQPAQAQQLPDTMIVEDQGFLRFRQMQDLEYKEQRSKRHKQRAAAAAAASNDVNHYSDA